MQHPAWMLILFGLVLAGVGLVWLPGPAVPWLGKLPGDIRIERDHTSIYIPLTTCTVVSLLLTGVLWLVRFLAR